MADTGGLTTPSPRALVWATVVLVVLLGASLLFLFHGGGSLTFIDSSQNTNSSQQGPDGANATTPPPAPEPSVILVRTGTITRVNTNNIRFTAPVYNEGKGVYESRELTAEIGNTTVITEVDRTALPVPPVPGQSAGSTPTPKPLALGDLENGNTVEVEAATNIKGETKFEAKEIRRILTQ